MTKPTGSVPARLNVIGSGSWGTALALLACANFDQVWLWGRSGSEALRGERQNRRYLPGIAFPPGLQVADQLEQLVEPGLRFLVVVPSHAFADIVSRLHQLIRTAGLDPANATLVWGTKGFDPKTGDLPEEVIHRVFPANTVRAVLSGPSFARETAAGLPTALTLACGQAGAAERLAHWFRTPTTRVYFSDDPVGVQLGAAIKNVMAIATGISDGLGFGANARAALITRGLAEMTRLGIALGGRMETFNGLTGVGDLVLTCTDNQSRNRRYGLGIGAGRSPEDVAEEIGQEIEGIRTTHELHRKARGLGVEMPITEHVYRVLYGGMEPDEAVRSLLGRDPGPEH
jgi:glycerol-3-phosphate dehydrogenase (NAD(P)+)